jgi:hypothetical protein
VTARRGQEIRPPHSTYLNLSLCNIERLQRVSKADYELKAEADVAYQIADNDLAGCAGSTSGSSGNDPIGLLFASDCLLDASDGSCDSWLGTWATAAARMAGALATLRKNLIERLAQLVWHFGGWSDVVAGNK